MIAPQGLPRDSPSDPNDQQGLHAEMAERALDLRDSNSTITGSTRGLPASFLIRFGVREQTNSSPGKRTARVSPGTFCILDYLAEYLHCSRLLLICRMQSALMPAKEIVPAVDYLDHMYSLRYDVRGPDILILERSQDVSSKNFQGLVFPTSGLGAFTNDPRAGKLLPSEGGRSKI